MSRIVNIGEVRQRQGKRYINPKHIEWLHTFSCYVCGRRPVEVHHTLWPVKTSRGAGRRAGDDEAVPMCPEHHAQLHRAPKSWKIKYGEQERELMDELWGKSPFNPDNLETSQMEKSMDQKQAEREI
jgi:hypothetical protein